MTIQEKSRAAAVSLISQSFQRLTATEHSLLSDALAALCKAAEDADRLDFVESLAFESRTGISVDFIKFVEHGSVVEKGFRLSSFRNLRERAPSLREAIDIARKESECF